VIEEEKRYKIVVDIKPTVDNVNDVLDYIQKMNLSLLHTKTTIEVFYLSSKDEAMVLEKRLEELLGVTCDK